MLTTLIPVFAAGVGLATLGGIYFLLGRLRDFNVATSHLLDEIRDEVEKADRVLLQLDARTGVVQRRIDR
jgi:hypothetical protein